MPTDPAPKRRVELGPTGECVRANVQRIRKGQRLTHADVVGRMADHGYRMPRTALSEIESGGRRVSTDDLVALAIALGVTPNALLLPPEYGERPYQVSGCRFPEQGSTLWDWAEGVVPLAVWQGESANAVFRQYARPKGYPEPSWVEPDGSNIGELREVASQMGELLEQLKALPKLVPWQSPGPLTKQSPVPPDSAD